MDIKAVLHTIGALLVFIGCSFILPIIVSIVYHESDLLPFVWSLAVTVSVGFLLWKLTPSNHDIKIREGFGIVTFSWVALSAFGALPFFFCLDISFTDAFFETMSGFTTTGATIFPEVESLPHGLLFWRSLTHWLGGMGIIVLSLAIMPMLGVGGMQLFKAEAPGPSVDKIKPRVQDTAKILWVVYLMLTVIEAILLRVVGMNWFDAICHTFGTMATGGFSTKNAGLMHYYDNVLVEYIIAVFMILAGINFALHYRFSRGRFSAYHQNSECRTYLGIITFTTVFLLFMTFGANFLTVEESFRKAIFQVASLLTTTGFHTADYEQWSVASQLLLTLLMFIGGCAGSTGGGIKVVRVDLTFRYLQTQFKRLVHPHAVTPVRFNNRPVSNDAIRDILGFVLVYVILFGVSSFLMSLLGLDLVTAVSTVISTLGNIGPGIGSVGPTENFAHIPVIGKWLLSFLMLAGRLEIFTVLIVFSKYMWRR